LKYLQEEDANRKEEGFGDHPQSAEGASTFANLEDRKTLDEAATK
jgi:hypothetical protein